MSRFYSLLLLTLFPTWALAVEATITLQWEHDGLTVNGDPVVITEWRTEIINFSNNEQVLADTLLDADGSLREWELQPVELDYGIMYRISLRAFDDQGRMSDPARVDYTIPDIPSAPNTLSIIINCPNGAACNVVVNGQ